MTRRRYRRLVMDTMVVIRGARAFRQKPPAPNTPELRLVQAWIDDDQLFAWYFSPEILAEYREVLRRLGVPREAVGRFLNRLRQGGDEVIGQVTETFSPDPKDGPFYACALLADADYIVTDNLRDFPPIPGRKRPRIITPAEAVALLLD
ncbi:MAG: putative toxin-antitoxin system toxin component, PIN family [Blastocatellia bacterium]